MSLDLVKYAFAAGELSPTLYGRSDLDKYDLGLALARNWFVDYRGGLSTRPGSIFCDFVQNDSFDTKFVPFKFAPALSRTYVILFGKNYIRFLQDGSYVLELGKTITGITQASPGVVTAAAHGYANGDWVKIFDVVGMEKLNQQVFEVAGVTTNTFQLKDQFGNFVNTTAYAAWISGGQTYRVYTLASPYDPDDLYLLRAYQSRSLIRLTHPDYPPKALVRISDTNWSLTNVVFGNQMSIPIGLAITPSATGTAGVGFTVTAVDAEGNESQASNYAMRTDIVNYLTTAGSCKFTWTAVAGAVAYRVYRTQIIPIGTEITRAQSIGFIGVSYGPEFIDNNIVPDYNTTPPNYVDPFADGDIEFVQVTAGGTGYSRTSTVSASGGGTGFLAYPVVNNAGVILAIVVVRGGKNYVNPVITVSGGTGATFTVDTGEASGNFPSVSTIFQQRQVYAATDNDPLTIWGSRPKAYENFDVSTVPLPADSYEFELDSEEVAPIRHLIPSRQGLVMFSQAGIWQLSANGQAVTATDALADPQTYTGCSLVPPLLIDTDIVYIEGKGQTVRLLTYSDYSKIYLGQDLSILSSHLITTEKQIEKWTYASDPFKLVYAVRSDGCLLTHTLVKEQNVFAWTQNWTQGLYLDILCLQEDSTDTVYQMVQRYVNGRWTKMIEQIANRSFTHVEESWCVDSGLSNTLTAPDANLQPGAASGNNVIFTASAAVFAVGDINSIIRAGGGKAVVTAYDSPTQVRCSIIRDIVDTIPEDSTSMPIQISSGDWTLDAPVTSVAGLTHLIGKTVKVLADGNVLPPKVVDANGVVQLGVEATRVIVGLGYSCVAQTLPPVSDAAELAGRVTRPIESVVRMNESRGLKHGDRLTNLYEVKERTNERYGEATPAQSKVKTIPIQAAFDSEGRTYYVQEYPLPCTILGWANPTEIGDVRATNK